MSRILGFTGCCCGFEVRIFNIFCQNQVVIYQRCIEIELKKSGLGFGREVEQVIYYEGIEVGTRRADFIVENQVCTL